MRKLVRLSLLTLALAASALSFSPNNVFAACTNGDTMIRQGRCCSRLEPGSFRVYIVFECINGGWRAIETICTTELC